MSDTILTPDLISKIIQDLTISMLGLGTPSGATDSLYQKVRIEWPPEGQPAWAPEEDVAFISCIPVDNPMDKQIDREIGAVDGIKIRETETRQRTWSVSWILYGPNSFSHADTIRDALFEQANHDALAVNNLFMITDFSQFTRTPENYLGQWWERVNLDISLNEGITRNVEDQYVTSVEVVIDTQDGTQVADFSISGGT